MCIRARRISSFCENFARLSWRTIFSHCLLPGFMIEVTYLTSDAFLLSEIVGSEYCRKRIVVAG